MQGDKKKIKHVRLSEPHTNYSTAQIAGVDELLICYKYIKFW